MLLFLWKTFILKSLNKHDEDFLFISCFLFDAQKNILVYGKVSDHTSKAGIEGVAVYIQNSTYRGAADKNGNFSILFPLKNTSLFYSKELVINVL